MKIPFTKAHGARNDFLLTWRADLPAGIDLVAASQAICDRHTGIGADGWLLLSPAPDADVRIELYNSDGSMSEISGNGTRCAAAFVNTGEIIRIATGAGVKTLRRISSNQFEMNMGKARIEELHSSFEDATILNVGNPQCAVFVDHFDFDWRAKGAMIERHPKFPNRTNVSFIRLIDEHTIDVRFWERGAGETMSSGTGSTGAAAASHARGLVRSPVEVQTSAGPLNIRWEREDILLTGPAQIVATGDFYVG
jgi:diaminopimelate epimerase